MLHRVMWLFLQHDDEKEAERGRIGEGRVESNGCRGDVIKDS